MRTFDDHAQQPGIEPFASDERRIVPSPLEFVRVPQVGLDEVPTEGKYPGPSGVELTFRTDREIDPVAQTFLGDAWVVSLPQQDLLVQQRRMPARGRDERLGERDVGSAGSVDGQPAPLLVGHGVVALNLHVETPSATYLRTAARLRASTAPSMLWLCASPNGGTTHVPDRSIVRSIRGGAVELNMPLTL